MRSWMWSLIAIPAIAITATVWAFAGGSSEKNEALQLQRDGNDLVISTQITRPSGEAITQPRVTKKDGKYILSYRVIYIEDAKDAGFQTETIQWRVPDASETSADQFELKKADSITLNKNEIQALVESAEL